MTPAEIKTKIQNAYAAAMANHSMQRQRSENIGYLFRGIHLYGREAGTDFVDTHLEEIVQEAVDRAECKASTLVLPVHGFGQAAVAGMIEALDKLTALRIEGKNSTITLTWAKTNIGLI